MIRLLIAASVAMIVSLLGSAVLIRILVRYGIGQPIRADGPEGHRVKAGTPTMGGLAVVAGAAVGYAVSDMFGGIFTRTGLIVMLTIIAGALVGLVDDWTKVMAARNLALNKRARMVGLNKRAKMIGLLAVGIGFAAAMVGLTSVHTNVSLTRFDYPGIALGRIGWSVWAVLLIIAASNAVNLTDGLDGLAAGAAGFGYAAFMIIGFWQFDHFESYHVVHALDLAIVSAAMVGGIVGFLWWNAAPAKIFMGDTGSLAIGCGLAGLALATNTHLLLPIVGGLFVIETASVIIQVAAFRGFRRRVFRMAPLHHHFELGGWPETTVIVRLWILSGLCTAVGLGLFYGDAVSSGIIDAVTRAAP